VPREWFVAPLDIIEQAIHFLISGETVQFEYDAIGRKSSPGMLSRTSTGRCGDGRRVRSGGALRGTKPPPEGMVQTRKA